MQVTKKDESNERFILKLVREHIPVLKSAKIVQGRGASLFDFWGLGNETMRVGVDVKVRDMPSSKYKDYFISKDKINMVKAKPEMDFYAVYYFTKDHVVKVFNLRTTNLAERNLEFTHKRTGKFLKQDLYTIPAHEHCFKAYLI